MNWYQTEEATRENYLVKMKFLPVILTLILGLCCVSESLRCNYCKVIATEGSCDSTVTTCRPDQSYCIHVRFSREAFGEIKRCARAEECEGEQIPTPTVSTKCCSGDLCN
ncbi:hypothetical protein AOXY_G31719 [Acipenser oxyrinchus oxyrinchus]|uniref:Snake toxin/toxin-like domain-containing protein n=1 Tax=Acipenser oxyrinchus oxyrinchus TaxID=40147 RepID=A0AAD8CJI6_ACIOX|nr:hypothetical protein AOXY_G31719 [Acipenser oxyrinchus oxyrinchus]